MKDTIYLIVSQNKVERMVKTSRSALDLYKGEIPVKLTIEIDSENWTKPFIEKHLIVDRWDKGIDVQDVHFEGNFVTEQESEMIREHRLQKMRDVLEQQGYRVEKAEEEL